MQRVRLAGWMICFFWLSLCVAYAAGDDEAKGDAKQPKAAAAQKPDAKPAENKAKAEKPKADAKKEPSVKRATAVQLAVKGSFPEGPSAAGLFGELEPSLADLIRRIDQAAEDKDVDGVILQLAGANLGRGKIHELRTAIARLRKAGKPVYAELESAGAGQYLVATACDEIVMPPSGTLMLLGVRAEVSFYKGLLDKLGIRADMIQMGKYKGAAEPYTRTGMSPELRENLEGIVDDLYEDLVSLIAKDRKLPDYQVKTLIDDGLMTPAAARKAGLIDTVAYPDQFRQNLKKKLKVDELRVVTGYKKKKLDTDFSGLTGMMKMMNLMFGGGKTAEASSKAKKIAVVYAVGMIMPGKSSTSLFGQKVLGSTTLVQALRKADEDETVQAIVLRIDSPGGSALASDLVWHETVRIKKPVIASMGDVAGSGGYYIAMGADKILAEPATITGSIGVVGGKLAMAGLFDKVGLTTETISRGKISGVLSSDEPFTPEERTAITRLIKDIYRQFVDKAAQGRKMPREKLEELAQGRIYTGRMAAANRLIDRVGTLADAVAEAKTAAGLKADEKVELLILPQPKSIFEELFGGPSISGQLKTAAGDLVETLAQAELLRKLFSEPALTLMPFRLEVK